MELPRMFKEELWPLFSKVSASDEMYIPTCLGLLGAIERGADGGSFSSQVVACRRVTYCHWGASPKSPDSFDCLDDKAVKAALEEGCVLARKFKPGGVGWEEWMTQMRAQCPARYPPAEDDRLARIEIEASNDDRPTKKTRR